MRSFLNQSGESLAKFRQQIPKISC